MAGKFSTFREDLLLSIVAATRQHGGGYSDAKQVADRAGLQYQPMDVRQACGVLADLGYIRQSPTIGGGADGGIHVQATGRGIEEAERIQDERRRLMLEASGGAPAADRVVRLDHNSQSYQVAAQAVENVMVAVEQSNELKSDMSYYERLVAELEAGKRLLKAAYARLSAVTAVLVAALIALATTASMGAINRLAEVAVDALLKLLGIGT